MTIIKAVRFCEIKDDEWIFFTDGKHQPIHLRFSVRTLRKHIDMSIPVFHAKPFYPFYKSTDNDYDWLFTISTKDYKDLLMRKDWI